MVAGCATAGTTGTAGPTTTTPPALPAAPWQAAPLAADAVPAVYAAQWRRAGNRHGCALLAPARTATAERATARAATFAGGWGVAYDTPTVRGAFGVAGTGAPAEPAPGATSYAWPDTLRWADGSAAGHGPEGGTGPSHLAYLRIPGQRCLYNVWSRLGRAHLVALVGELRFVPVAAVR